MKIDPRDFTLQEHAPIVPAPAFGEFAPLEEPGHRYIAARNGLFIEVRRPWLYVLWPITQPGAIAPALPYGEVTRRMSFLFGKLPRELMQRFLEEAKKVTPFEHAAWILWDAQAKQLVYRDLDIQEFGQGGVRYNRPVLVDHESLAVDLHSHGDIGAFFSGTDDVDDAGEVKLSVVLGDVKPGSKPAWALRLCALGVYITLPGPKDL
jgi:PRTRC genetic system protein A